jgi:hypothetical protein
MEVCKWCLKEMEAGAIRCPHCGKLRKDIYDDKMKCYFFCIVGGLLLGLGIADSSKVYFLIAGVIGVIGGLYYYVRTSQKLKSYWWM